MNIPTFGKLLRQLRHRAGMSQKDLGFEIGCSQKQISYLESGKCYPSPDEIDAIVTILGASSQDLDAINLAFVVRAPRGAEDSYL